VLALIEIPAVRKLRPSAQPAPEPAE